MIKELIYKIKRPYHLIKTGWLDGLPAMIKYGFPARKLHISVITGTDGKTTSSTLLYHVMKSVGIKVGLISTVAAYLGQKEVDTGFHVTSPKPSDLHRFMAGMVEQGMTHLVLEVTSHGDYQWRTFGVKPSLAGLTNIERDHYDYFINSQNYFQAKANILRQAPTVVINQDSSLFHKLKKILEFKHQVITYALDMKLNRAVKTAIGDRFPEAYNQQNARLVYSMAKQLHISDEDFIKSLATFPGVSGRMEYLATPKKFEVVVDFAHTPQGLEAVLTALKKKLKKTGRGRLIAVGGSAGLRDPAKRPLMGQVLANLADLVILTAEDPRTENVWSIIRQMKEQLTAHHHKIISIPDRYQAISFALTKLAQRSDIVLIFGKGHEKSMCYGLIEHPWSDQQAVSDIFKENS